ncbi:MAG: hypothetical protein HZB65_00585 [Candidatus Aenigmarchaeota archaeon]|nr:hypothetical protein [Candidatus Aenigmarchaeota archaeon]
MKEFRILLENKPLEFVEFCEALSRSGINIKSIVAESDDKVIRIHLITEDEKTTKTELDRKKLVYTTNEILAIKMIDKPGELAKVMRKLSNAKIRIDSFYQIGREDEKSVFAFSLQRIAEAKAILKQFLE